MAKKQKILHIVEAMGGGVFTFLVELTNNLSEDYDVTVAFGIRSETPDNYADYFNDKVNLIRVNNFERSVNPLKDLKAYFELQKIINNVHPDIIHLHSSKAGAIGRMMFSNKSQKMFYTPHGYSFLMEDISPVKRKVYKVIEKICGMRNCVTVACGKGEYEESLKVSKKSTYIDNGINMKEMDACLAKGSAQYKTDTSDNKQMDLEVNSDISENRTDSIKSKKEFTVYTVGRIDYQKNPEMFNEIAKLMPDIHFVWIGDGGMRGCLSSDNIYITGWTERSLALTIAKDYDAFILPSRWEGLPISLLEAMYMKKVCIVSNVVGNRDIVKDGVTGYICNTAEEFKKAIQRVKDHPDDSIIEKAYDEITNHYNSKCLCDRYRELYGEE